MLTLILMACTGASSGAQDPADDSSPSGVATFSAEELVWTGLTVGFSEVRPLDVLNTGSGLLDVTDAAIVTDPGGVFSVDFTAVSLEPDDKVTMLVSALLTEDAPATGELRVRTSDPSATEVLIPLVVD